MKTLARVDKGIGSRPTGSTAANSRLIRVFPRRTKATPDDAMAYVGPPDLFAQADAVHVSVTFTADKAIAERLAEEWSTAACLEDGKAHGFKNGSGGGGQIPCPVCASGTLHYSIAGSNGHLHGHCSTEGCVSWMQ